MDSNDDPDGQQLLEKLLKDFPEDFKHHDYIKYVKRSLVAKAKEEMLVKNAIEPFYKSLPSTGKRLKTGKGSSKPPDAQDKFIFTDSELNHKGMGLLTAVNKIKATSSAVVHDGKLPEQQHILFVRALCENSILVLNISGGRAEPFYREALIIAANAMTRLVHRNTISTGDGQCDRIKFSLEDFGLEFFLNFLIEYITIDFKNVITQMNKCELVSDIIYYLTPQIIRRRMFELLCSAVKHGLNRIHRASKVEKNDFLLPIPEVETLFRYLMILERVVITLTMIQESELVTLRCMENTVQSAMNFPLIGIYISRIALIAGTTASKQLKEKEKQKEKEKPNARKNTSPVNNQSSKVPKITTYQDSNNYRRGPQKYYQGTSRGKRFGSDYYQNPNHSTRM